jgi:hypothetical protein
MNPRPHDPQYTMPYAADQPPPMILSSCAPDQRVDPVRRVVALVRHPVGLLLFQLVEPADVMPPVVVGSRDRLGADPLAPGRAVLTRPG